MRTFAFVQRWNCPIVSNRREFECEAQSWRRRIQLFGSDVDQRSLYKLWIDCHALWKPVKLTLSLALTVRATPLLKFNRFNPALALWGGEFAALDYVIPILQRTTIDIENFWNVCMLIFYLLIMFGQFSHLINSKVKNWTALQHKFSRKNFHKIVPLVWFLIVNWPAIL